MILPVRTPNSVPISVPVPKSSFSLDSFLKTTISPAVLLHISLDIFLLPPKSCHMFPHITSPDLLLLSAHRIPSVSHSLFLSFLIPEEIFLYFLRKKTSHLTLFPTQKTKEESPFLYSFHPAFSLLFQVKRPIHKVTLLQSRGHYFLMYEFVLSIFLFPAVFFSLSQNFPLIVFYLAHNILQRAQKVFCTAQYFHLINEALRKVQYPIFLSFASNLKVVFPLCSSLLPHRSSLRPAQLEAIVTAILLTSPTLPVWTNNQKILLKENAGEFPWTHPL